MPTPPSSPLPLAPRPRALGLQRAIKRGIDIVAGGLMLVPAAPVIALMALALRLESPGPAFFVQERVGRGGRIFRLIKMRTLYLDGFGVDARRELSGDDPRITPIGRWLRRSKLDELPQLWHVLKGEMSLVGPRPVIPIKIEHGGIDATERQSVRPGLTGAAQVCGNTALDWTRRVAIDTWYVRHWTLGLDLRILGLTPWRLREDPKVSGIPGRWAKLQELSALESQLMAAPRKR